MNDLNLGNENLLGTYSNLDPALLEDFSDYVDTLTTELRDRISSYGESAINPLSSLVLNYKTLLTLEADHPLLPNSNDQSDAGQIDAELLKFVIRQEFGLNVQAKLDQSGLSDDIKKMIFQAVMNPQKPETQSFIEKHPELKSYIHTLSQQATELTKQECHLSLSWTIDSEDPQAWQPLLPTPYDEARQFEINTYHDETINQLLEKYQQTTEMSAEDVSAIKVAFSLGHLDALPEELQKIAIDLRQTAANLTQIQYGLPLTWEKGTTDVADWTPNNPSAYSSSQQQEINQAFISNFKQVIEKYIQQSNPPLAPSIQAELKKINPEDPFPPQFEDLMGKIKQVTTQLTASQYGLPITWTPSTVDIQQWVPIHLNPVSSMNLSLVKLNSLFNNFNLLVEDYGAVTTQVLSTLPSDHPSVLAIAGTGSLSDYLKIISSAIQLAKSTLRDLQIADAQRSEKNVSIKFDMMMDKLRQQQEALSTNLQKSDKEKQMDQLGLSMQIIGPIISALMTVAAVLSIILTMGLATPGAVGLIIAAVIIGTVMTAYAVADSVVGITPMLVESFKEMLSSIEGPQWVRDLVKAIIIIAVVAILIAIVAVMVTSGNVGQVATIGSRVAASITNLSASLAAKVAQQFSTAVSRQLIQEGIRVGIVETVKQLAIQAIVLFVTTTNALPDLVASIMEAAGCDKKSQMIARMVTMAATMLVLLPLMMKAMGGIPRSVIKEAQIEAQTILQKAIKQVKQGFDETIEFCAKTIREAKKIPEKVKNNLMEFLEGFKDLAATNKGKGILILSAIETAPAIVGVITSSIRASILLEMHRLILAESDFEAAQEVLNAFIKMLEQLLANLQAGMDVREESIVDLNKEFMKIYNQASMSYSHLAGAINAGQSA
jgi:hypothetical protein